MASTLSPTTQVGQVPWLTLSSAQQMLLKWLAILFMFVDHANCTLWTSQPWFFTIGRLAFPLFAFLISYNVGVRGVSARRYLLPLTLFGIASQVPAMLALDHEFLPLNIFFTMLLGSSFLALRRWFSHQLPEGWLWQGLSWLMSLYLMLVVGIGVEYSPLGVLLIPTMMVLLTRPSVLGAVVIASMLVLSNGPHLASLTALLVIPLIKLVSTLKLSPLPRTKWLFYAFYPGHLIVLWLLRRTL